MSEHDDAKQSLELAAGGGVLIRSAATPALAPLRRPRPPLQLSAALAPR